MSNTECFYTKGAATTAPFLIFMQYNTHFSFTNTKKTPKIFLFEKKALILHLLK